MSIIDSVISVIAPHSCLICGAEGRLVCGWCGPEVFAPVPSRCYHCKTMTKNSEVCPKCRRLAPLKHVWVATDYDLAAKSLMRRYKFEDARAAAATIAEYLSGAVPFLEDRLVVPVPTATLRVRQRGYDHTLLLARRLSKETGLQYMCPISRLGQTRQVGTKRTQRLNQLKEAFYVKKPDNVAGRRILLVDDVLTTGATIGAAAQALKYAGAKTVDAVVFAHKQ